MLFLSAPGLANEIKIKFCDTCGSDSQFARAGETSALTTHPLLAEGAQQILVIDADSESMRMIVVTREAIDPTTGPGGGIWSTTSAIADLDPDLQTQALDGVRAVQAFMAETRNEHAGDLDFGVVPIDSAADLLGTGDVPDFVRDTFAQALNSRLTDGWVHQITWDALSFANRGRQPFHGYACDLRRVYGFVRDGTSIDAALTKVLEDEDGDISFELAVKMSTASGPGLTVIPATPGRRIPWNRRAPIGW